MLLIVVRWVLFGEFIQLLDALLHPCRVFEILYYLLDLKFYVHSTLSWLLCHLLHHIWLIVPSRFVSIWLLSAWQALDDNCNPPLKVHISLGMVLNDCITLPNSFSSELDNFIDKSLNNSYTKIIIL